MYWTMEEQRAPPTTATQLTLPDLAELWTTADSVSSPSTVAQLRLPYQYLTDRTSTIDHEGLSSTITLPIPYQSIDREANRLESLSQLVSSVILLQEGWTQVWRLA